MPLYEFRCESCGHVTETIQLFSDPLPTICQTCGGSLKKLLSAPAVQFKGSGFYLTDYGRSGRAADSEKRAADAGDAKPSGEAKPSADARPGESKSSGDAKPSGEGKPSGETKSSGESKSGTAGNASAGTGGDAKTAG